MAAVQRFGIQLRRARCTERLQKTDDLAREAVSCNAGLGGRSVEYGIPIDKIVGCMARNHVRVWSRSEAATKQVNL